MLQPLCGKRWQKVVNETVFVSATWLVVVRENWIICPIDRNRVSRKFPVKIDLENVQYFVATSKFHVQNHRVLIKLQNYNFFCLFNFYQQFNSYSNLDLFKIIKLRYLLFYCSQASFCFKDQSCEFWKR